MSDVVVETHQLSKHYGSFVALDQLTIHVRRGEVLGFIGPNGAGKTTTIRVLVGLLRPTSGRATIAGLDCTRDAAKVKNVVGYMPDTFGGYENMRVREYLDFFGAAYRIPRRERGKRIEEVLQLSNASHMKDLLTDALSHGMRQKVGLARTMLHQPQVLILDEPANGLDPLARMEMRELILRLAAAGKTLIVSSHILPELARVCSSVAILAKGKLKAFGPLQEVLRSVRQARTMELVTLKSADLPRAAETLRAKLGEDAKITVMNQESTVRVQTGAGDDALASALSAVIGGGIAVAEFREVTQDLEDAYLSVTGQAAAMPVGGAA